MKSIDVRKKYIEFFVSRGHAEIPSAPLVPQNDPTTLFNSSGMQPLVPYLLGEPHPAGKRLVNSQKAIRTQDIEEVGDNRHTTFFEMLGNWSLGDYFKKEQLPWIFEFLTKDIGLDPNRLYVTVFEGNESVPKDTESIAIWKEVFANVGIDAKPVDAKAMAGDGSERIFAYPAKKNWWSRSGEPEKMPAGEPGGPDSEVFFDFGKELGHHEKSEWKSEPCHPNCDCGRFMEIANSVFMQYKKEADGSLKELSQKNVDFGGGLERIVAATNDDSDVFRTDLFTPIIQKIEALTKKSYEEEKNKASMRIIADHVKAATLLIVDGVLPANKGQGYVLRRLLRRASVKFAALSEHPNDHLSAELATIVLAIYEGVHGISQEQYGDVVHAAVETEIGKFQKTLHAGLKVLQKTEHVDGKTAFDLYQTYGFPLEITTEILQEKGSLIDKDQFEAEFRKHQELSRTAAAGMFKGGLADHSEATTKLHTAHHLLLAALQKLVDPTIKQRGSNITGERLRMDFSFERKLTPVEIDNVTKLVNEEIKKDLPVARVEMKREEAERVGAQMEFGHKYPDMVSVYFVGPQESYFSAEFCGGPHVTHTGDMGSFAIIKEESAAAGIRRIYATLT